MDTSFGRVNNSFHHVKREHYQYFDNGHDRDDESLSEYEMSESEIAEHNLENLERSSLLIENELDLENLDPVSDGTFKSSPRKKAFIQFLIQFTLLVSCVYLAYKN